MWITISDEEYGNYSWKKKQYYINQLLVKEKELEDREKDLEDKDIELERKDSTISGELQNHINQLLVKEKELEDREKELEDKDVELERKDSTISILRKELLQNGLPKNNASSLPFASAT